MAQGCVFTPISYCLKALLFSHFYRNKIHLRPHQLAVTRIFLAKPISINDTSHPVGWDAVSGFPSYCTDSLLGIPPSNTILA
ncbi:MAG TPA: hypothetical protein ENG92_00290 [Thiolapillus brandeum]|uniref:Uncharacterized protein n=1 Tax=Thiolapillus brandeum TaxID=1076588 RepID=A0A831KAR9_9GAMM|nr:hypothetical protein [Thiolapillus brandeum]